MAELLGSVGHSALRHDAFPDLKMMLHLEQGIRDTYAELGFTAVGSEGEKYPAGTLEQLLVWISENKTVQNKPLWQQPLGQPWTELA